MGRSGMGRSRAETVRQLERGYAGIRFAKLVLAAQERAGWRWAKASAETT